jgi:hypothetical protein
MYIVFISEDNTYALLNRTGGTKEYKLESGEISVVTIEVAGKGVRKLRIANLSPETSDMIIGEALRKYGKVMGIQEEKWPDNTGLQFLTGYKWLI